MATAKATTDHAGRKTDRIPDVAGESPLAISTSIFLWHLYSTFVFILIRDVIEIFDFEFTFPSTSNFIILIDFLEFSTLYLYNWTHSLLLEDCLCFPFHIL